MEVTQEVLDTINKVVNKLAYKFRFGYHDVDDIRQQGRMFALDALERFEPERNKKLYNFLYTHVRNRLINYKRDNYSRFQIPCLKCPFYDEFGQKSKNKCMAFSDKMECDKWSVWFKTNQSKKAIVAAPNLGDDYEDCAVDESDFLTNLSKKEIVEILDAEIPVEFRADYQRLKQGAFVPVARLRILKEAIIKILEDKDII